MVYIPIAKRDYEEWKNDYPCMYYPGKWMDNYYGCPPAQPSGTLHCNYGSYWVTNHVPYPALTYCGSDTYFYAYCNNRDFRQDVTGKWDIVGNIPVGSKKTVEAHVGVK